MSRESGVYNEEFVSG